MLKNFLNTFYLFIFQPKPTVEQKPLGKKEIITFVVVIIESPFSYAELLEALNVFCRASYPEFVFGRDCYPAKLDL